MYDSPHKPTCRLCGNQMYLMRFQSTVTDEGIDREQFFECLSCNETDFVMSHAPHSRIKERAA